MSLFNMFKWFNKPEYLKWFHNQPNQIARTSGACCYFPTVGTDYEIAATISRLRDNGMLNVQVEKL